LGNTVLDTKDIKDEFLMRPHCQACEDFFLTKVVDYINEARKEKKSKKILI
jgi:hypothetical protein